jgi:hypothetical protein
MADTQTLAPARQMAASNKAHFPNESPEYRAARNAHLAEEIELRRHLERVAEQRRALPPGGEIPQDFEFASESGPIRLSNLFRDKDTVNDLQHDVRTAAQGTVPLLHLDPRLLEWHRDQSA